MNEETDILVIGGGVIGFCSAYFLQEAGRQVTLLERDTICSGCSFGNSGLVVPSHCFPLAMPGVIRQSLKWMLNPESPFYIRPRFNPALFSWLWQFRAACTQERMRHAVRGLVDMSQSSIELYDDLMAREKLECGYDRCGSFLLFRSQEGMAAGLHEADLLYENGISYRSMTGAEVNEMDPAIRRNLAGGIYYDRDAFMDPSKFVYALAECVKNKGVSIEEETEVTGFDVEGGKIRRVVTSRGDIVPQQVVLAAGSWSPGVARGLPFKLPVQPAKGYSVTFENPGVPLKYPVIMAEARAGVNPMGTMMRLAGTLEMTGIDLSINTRRVRAVVRAVADYIDGIEESVVNENPWCGMRPCTPDGLPMVGTPVTVSNLIVATGHAMLGMTLGPGTGRLVADLATGREPHLDPVPYDPARFQRAS